MRQSLPFTYSSIAAVLLAALAQGCGHSQDTLDAFKQSKKTASQGTGGGSARTQSALSCDVTFDWGSASGSAGAAGAASQDSCEDRDSQQFDPDSMRPFCVPGEVATEVDNVLGLMSTLDKANQMMGVDGTEMDYLDIERSPDVEVAGFGTIRGYKYRDAGKGVNLDAGQNDRPRIDNFSTVFPAPSVRAASWDLGLERRVGAALGDETAASKNNMLLAPCMNIIRHPYWGRTQETYGEDTYHIGRMATAFTVGLQEYVVGCAKHFAANNIEKARATQNAIMDEQTLREIYGRHFEMVIQDGGIGCIMAAYNKINGVKSTQNEHLLRDVLKAPVEDGGFGFGGMVITDWWAMPGGQTPPAASEVQTVADEAVQAGTDVEVPWTYYYNESTLPNVPDQKLINDAAKRILTQKFLFWSALESDGWSITPPKAKLLDNGSIEPNDDHEALAEETELKSAVLVTNGLDDTPVLPLEGATNIAVVGPDEDFSLYSSSVPKSCGFDEQGNAQQGQENPNPRACTFHFATDPALGDRGSSRVNGDPARSYGPAKGMRTVAGDLDDSITVTSGSAPADAEDADAVVVVVGYTPGDEGEEYAIREGGDRSTLDLPEGQNEFVQSVLDLDKPTIIIIESGSIVNLPWLSHSNKNQATIWAGYPGQMGGLALAKLIFGLANFSGKMPLAWPKQADLPPFTDVDQSGEPKLDTEMGYFFGYREYDKRKYIDKADIELVFPFGHGLSYSTFEYSNLVLPCQTVTKDAIFRVQVDIRNTSEVDGDEVAMLFIKPPSKPNGIDGERPWKELKSFARVSVPAGETVTAELPVRVRDLRRWEGGANGEWVVDSGDYTILVGKDADDAENASAELMGTVTINGD